ncbi:Calx-beta domain-containing protein [Oceaniglobus roseus]|uniref:Calx-beta domain-containing protein n=1 Tax=Oceaniglobus roseus TaxID=1737570 RepID=UPI000C7F1420|nr:Calx-beta domain-containing protein [Kandeliimicrobium roseum]
MEKPGHFSLEINTLTILAGQTVATISVANFSDNTDDDDRNFTLELSDPVSGVLAGGEPVLTATGVLLDNDGATEDRALFVSDPVILEGDGTKFAVFELRLSEPATGDLTFAYATADGTATADEDYVATSGSVTFAAGQTVASVTVEIIGDTVSEVAETFSLVVNPTVSIANGVADSTGLATLVDDDTTTGLPVISLVAAEGDEGEGVEFRVVLSQPSLADVTVSWRTVQDGSGLSDGDYDGAFGTLTILAGQTVATISVANFSDNTDDDDRNFTLELSDPVNGVLAGGELVLTATGVLLDNDGATEDRALFVSDPVILEGDGTKFAVFELRLSEPSATALTIDYATADGTATAGGDYVSTSGSVVFAAGQTVASVSVEIVGDTISEVAETFSLIAAPTTGIANGVADAGGVATLIDDDTATGLPVISLVAAEGDEGETVDFLVVLSEPSLADVFVDWRTVADGSALPGTDFSSNSGVLQIPAGQTVATISIANSSDNTDKDDRNFTLELSDPVNAVLAGGESTLTATGVLLDDDGATEDRGLFVSDPVIFEPDIGSKLAVFEVRLSEPSATPITLNYATADGTAIAGEDYVAASGSITFAPAQTVASVSVTILGDQFIEPDETFTLTVTPAIGIANGTADNTGTAVLLNEDDGTIRGTGGPDSLEGSAGDDTMFGFGGNDTLAGNDGSDLINGGNGDDLLQAGDGDDTINGDGGNDAIFGGSGANLLGGGAGNDTAFGYAGNDTLNGSDGFDSLNGGGGADELRGGDQADTLDGSFGNDLVLGQNGNDVLFGGVGNDTLNGGLDADSIDGGTGNDLLEGFNGSDTLVGGDGRDTLLGQQGNDFLFGGIGNDSLVGGGNNDSLNGGNDADTLDGGSGSDSLDGGDGADLVLGAGGNDTLLGGGGDDRLAGSFGFDFLDGGGGNDTLEGDEQADTLLGNVGNDVLSGGVGNDSLDGGGNDDTLFGGDNNDTLRGDFGNDVLNGGAQRDLLDGGGNNDNLVGGAGNDTLLGRNGDDTLLGGGGDDTLTGGFQTDTFVYARNYERDTVTDFSDADDILSLNDNLWGGGLTAQQVVDTYASVLFGNTVFDFGGGDILTVNGVINEQILVDNIAIF